MRKLFFFSYLLTLFLTGCTNVSVLTTGQPSDSETSQQKGVISSPKPSSTAFLQTATRAAPVTPTKMVPPPTPDSIPTLALIYPEVVSVCPQTPEVSLSKFGLEDYYLIVRPYDPRFGKIDPQSSGAVVVPLDRPTPQVIHGSRNRGEWELMDYRIAADGQFVELEYTKQDISQRQIWRSSWDGQQQYMVSEFSLPPLPPHGEGYLVYYYRRIDEHWYAGMKSDIGTDTDYPVLLYHSSTGETRELPSFPDGTNVENFFWMDGSLYMTYYQGSEIDKVVLYNLDSFTETPIFQWLLGKEEAFSLNTFWFYRDGKFMLQVLQPYGVDLGIDLDVDTVMSNKAYEEVMQAFYLPGSMNSLMVGGFRDSPKGYYFERYNHEQNITFVYFLELEKQVVRKYCYTVGTFVFPLWTTHSVSPDDQYIAYTHMKLGIEDHPDKIIRVEILDMMTGEYAALPNANYEVLGWGRK